MNDHISQNHNNHLIICHENNVGSTWFCSPKRSEWSIKYPRMMNKIVRMCQYNSEFFKALIKNNYKQIVQERNRNVKDTLGLP